MKIVLALIIAVLLNGCSVFNGVEPKQHKQPEKEIVVETVTKVIEPPASLLKIYKLPNIDIVDTNDVATTQVAMATMIVELSRVKRKYENNIMLMRKYISDVKKSSTVETE